MKSFIANAKFLLLVRYLIVAVLAYLIDMGGYILLIKFDFNPLVANVLVKILAAIFGFFAHRIFTYQITGSHNIGPHSIRYFGLALMYTPVATVILFLALKFIPNLVLAKFICDVLLFFAVYWVTSKFTFFKEPPLTQQSSP